MTTLDRGARLARHYPVGPRQEGHICNACESTWPCDVALALDEAAKGRAIRDATDHPARQALATCQALLDGIANRAGLHGRDGLDLDSLVAAGLIEVDELLDRLAEADRLVGLLDRIAALEDGTPEDWWRAIPLHGEVAAIVGAWMPLARTGGA